MPVVTRTNDPRRVINCRAHEDGSVELTLAEPLSDGSFWPRHKLTLSVEDAADLVLHLDCFADCFKVRLWPALEKEVRMQFVPDTRDRFQLVFHRPASESVELGASHALNLSANVKAVIDFQKEHWGTRKIPGHEVGFTSVEEWVDWAAEHKDHAEVKRVVARLTGAGEIRR